MDTLNWDIYFISEIISRTCQIVIWMLEITAVIEVCAQDVLPDSKQVFLLPMCWTTSYTSLQCASYAIICYFWFMSSTDFPSLCLIYFASAGQSNHANEIHRIIRTGWSIDTPNSRLANEHLSQERNTYNHPTLSVHQHAITETTRTTKKKKKLTMSRTIQRVAEQNITGITSRDQGTAEWINRCRWYPGRR